MARRNAARLLVRGDLVKLKLQGGEIVELPDDFGLIHDPVGGVCDRCVIYITAYALNGNPVVSMPHELESIARAYFGNHGKLVDGSVELPDGPWQPVGEVVRIYYARYGNQKGLYYHAFKRPVALHKQSRGPAYKLVLPDGCVVDSHGFVWP